MVVARWGGRCESLALSLVPGVKRSLAGSLGRDFLAGELGWLRLLAGWVRGGRKLLGDSGDWRGSGGRKRHPQQRREY